MRARDAGWLAPTRPPPLALGFVALAVFVVVEMVLADALGLSGTHSGSVVCLLGLLVASWIWGPWLAVGVPMVSAVASDVWYVPPARDLEGGQTYEWVAVALLLVMAALVGAMVRLSATAVQVAECRQEAELLAEEGRLLLGSDDLRSVLPEASRRLARALRLPYAAIELDDAPADASRPALPLRCGSRTGNLVVPASLPEPVLRRLRERVVPGVERLLQAAIEREAMGDSLRASRDELRELLTEQACLRRLAVLVAHGAPPDELLTAVTAETTSLLGADATRLMRHIAPGTISVIAQYGMVSPLGEQLPVDGGAAELVQHTSRPVRVDSYDDRRGALADLARHEGFHSSVAAPVMVEDSVWGSLVVLWRQPTPSPPGTEQRLAQFSELVATAVANAESRAQLDASRARIVLAADEARRRIERDLHDGVQQRLVSLGLELRAAEASVPGELDELKGRLGRTVEGLTSMLQDLREISRGLHPAILSQCGLTAALKALARRSPVPVTISPGPQRQLPSCVEVAAYYVVSEAIANVAKHAHASSVEIEYGVTADTASRREVLRLAIHDDGVGNADPTLGSGLVGLVDRVEALGGQLRIASPPDVGTTLLVTLPTDIDSGRA